MKHIQFISNVLLSSLVLLHVTSIWAQTPKPEKCPSVASIQQAHLDILDIYPAPWAVGIKGNFDTQNDWVFAAHVSKEQFPTKEQAVAKVNQALSTLGFPIGPTEFLGGWACLYHMDDVQENVAMATTTN